MSSDCRQCGGSEYILKNGNLSPCVCLVMKKRKEYAESIIPSRYSNSKLLSLIPCKDLKISVDRQENVIRMLCKEPLSGYVFLGPTGVGKTHLMYSLVDYAVYAGRKVVALTCSQFIKISRDYEFSKEESPLLDSDLVANFTGPEVPLSKTLHIFLDEMDKIKLSEYTQIVLFDLVNSAYDYPDRIKLTITSNLPQQKFEEVFGAAFYRKLKTISKPIIYGAN